MTLLEVLVATGILALISGLAFVSLDNLIRSKQSLQEANEAINQFNLTIFQLQSDVKLAVAHESPLVSSPWPEFSGDSQSISLHRFASASVPVTRSRQQANNQSSQPLQRIRWAVRNGQLIRSSQPAAAPQNSNQWVERPMLAVKTFHCSYHGLTGQNQPRWPATESQNNQLPEWLGCELTTADDQRSVLHLTPMQRGGFL